MAIVSDLSAWSRYDRDMTRAALTLGLMLLCTVAARADDHDDQYRAYEALEAGEILPLGTILSLIADVAPGAPIEVELERDDGLWVYELEIRGPRGRLIELEVDAATGRILEMEDDED